MDLNMRLGAQTQQRFQSNRPIPVSLVGFARWMASRFSSCLRKQLFGELRDSVDIRTRIINPWLGDKGRTDKNIGSLEEQRKMGKSYHAVILMRLTLQGLVIPQNTAGSSQGWIKVDR